MTSPSRANMSPQPLRIAMVSDSIYPYQKGGKEVRLHELSQRLAHRGHEVHIYTMKWWKGPDTKRHGQVWLHAIAPLRPLYTHDRRSMAEAIWFGLATFKLLRAKFDVIDVDSMPFFPLYSARLVCWLRGKKLHATWHEVTELTTWQAYAGPVAGLIGWTIEQISMRLPDVIISNSDHTTRRLQEAKLPQPITTIPLGVNLDDIQQVPAAPEPTDIIFAGRLLAHKNVDLLVRAIALLRPSRPGLSAVIVGNGPERTRLRRLIKQLDLGDTVELISFVPRHQDLIGLMKSARVFVLPSVREGFSLVTVEANAAGLPVITTNHPDNAARELITPGVNGYLTIPTAEALAGQISRVLDEAGRLQPHAYIDRYNWDTASINLEKVLVG